MPQESTRFLLRMLLVCALALQMIGCAGSLPPETRTPGTIASVFPYPRVDALEHDHEFGGLVYVIEAGPESAPPLVLIHGFGSQAARDFDPILPELSKHHRVLAFDLPGFGRSTLAEENYSPQRYIRFIRAMIESRFPGQPVALVGHSMGGALAIAYAGTHPDAVSRLALLNTAGVLYYRDFLDELGNDGTEDPLDDVLGGLREAAMALPLALDPIETFDVPEREDPVPLLSVETNTSLLFFAQNFGPALYQVTAPVLLGWSRRDPVTPGRTAAALRFVLPSSQCVVFENSGHVPMESEPERVAEALHAFFSADSLPTPAPREAFKAGRIGTCIDSADRLFEGDYDAIYLNRCEDALLRDVRTRRLWIERSVATLEHVEVTAKETAVTFARSDVEWAGGHVQGATCFESDGSQLNLAAVHCDAEDSTMRVFSGSQMRASISRSRLGDTTDSWHGDYEFGRAEPGAPAPFSDPLPEGKTANSLPRPAKQRLCGRGSVP